MAILYKITVAENTALRPNLSAIEPAITAPIAIPTRPIEPIAPICPADKPHSLPSTGNTKAISPVSIASNNQPRPVITNNL